MSSVRVPLRFDGEIIGIATIDDDNQTIAAQVFYGKWPFGSVVDVNDVSITNKSATFELIQPHSRACGTEPHAHGLQCSTDCPTCYGGVNFI